MTAQTTARLRTPRSALLAVGVLLICAIQLASAVGAWWPLALLIPVLAAAWVWRSGVDLTDEGVVVRAALGSTATPWNAIGGIRVGRRGELWLVRADGSALRMPGLRVRNLARLHEASAGRLGLPAEG